jgi:hypothetical protein
LLLLHRLVSCHQLLLLLREQPVGIGTFLHRGTSSEGVVC